jgi:hypothetical protein
MLNKKEIVMPLNLSLKRLLCPAMTLICIFFVMAPFARAQYVRRDAGKTTTTTTTTTRDHDDDYDDEDEEEVITDHGRRVYIRDPEPIDRVVEETFGSRSASGMAGCKTDDRAKDAITGLKSDCNAWIKDRRSELKDRFVTGTCSEKCDDCGMSMQRCAVTGRVHYTLRK